MKFSTPAILGGALALAACSTTSLMTAGDSVAAAGQLFCAMAAPSGQLVVALADASGMPVVVTDRAASWVDAACAVIGGVPVSPPRNAVTVPVKAAKVPPAVLASIAT